MDESNEDLRVVPELYFLIAKFLSGGPLKETAQTLLRELETVEVLPRRVDWEGAVHSQSYDELNERFSDIPWDRLASVCSRALKLAPIAPLAEGQPPRDPAAQDSIQARLSLLSDTLVKCREKFSIYKQDHSLVRRLTHRELGLGPAPAPGGCGGRALFPPRMLSALQLQRRTLGHLSAVYCLVFDCTGRYVVTGADDLLVKVWSARDGRLLGTLRGAGAEITDVCISADNCLLAAGSVERLVRVWCLATGAPKAVLHAHGGTITSVHWAPPHRSDVRYLASTSTDGSVAFWTCSHDGQFLSQPVQYVERMRPGACHMICAAWSAGGAFLAAGSADHHVRVYAQPSTGPPTRVLEMSVHSDAVDSISWAHLGLRFVSGSKDGCAALWTLHATQWRHQLLRCESESADDKKLKVTMVCWDVSDQFVLTAVSDCTVRVWCARSGSQVRSLHGHRDEAYVLEAHPFLPGVLLSAGHDGQLFVWDATTGEALAKFHNNIEGQGDGAIFDAKWGGGASVAATDSHGHLLLLGLGAGHPLLKQLPQELFFHTDYRPLVRDALGGALDEQTETPPHEMPPPFLVDVEGAPHAPKFQRLVPGRENLALSQLVPAHDRNRIDLMIEALAAERTPPAGYEQRGVWRGEGVRHTAGSWQRGELAAVCRPLVQPVGHAQAYHMHHTAMELNEMEQAWWRREMRRRPLMISTGGPAERAARRKVGRRPNRERATARGDTSRTVPRPQPAPAASPEPEPDSDSSTSDESVRMSAWDRSTSHSDVDISFSGGSKSDESSSSSQYSDWEAGQPPARARRKPVPTARYSPSTTTTKRNATTTKTAPETDATNTATASTNSPSASTNGPRSTNSRIAVLQEQYRPGEWLTCVTPRKAPYHPQMADHVVYFTLGHKRYFEAVAEKDLYKVNPRDKPWERTHVNECEFAKVVGIKYVIKPPRIACLRLSCETDTSKSRTFTVKYHDMADVIDFLVPRQQYDIAVARRWGPGDRFRCMIDDSWWTGVVVEKTTPEGAGGGSRSAAAASHFLSLKVRWDNGEMERLSPWDLEPIDPDRLPPEPGGCVPVLAHELEAVLHKPGPLEWGPQGDRATACRTISQHIAQVMTLAVAEPFVAPVDLQLYPDYAKVVAYPIDLATIKARFDNLFYRRAAAAQFDVRYLASNAELFNDPHSLIVRQARLVTDLLLHIIANWPNVDVVAKYHSLAANYHSTDEDVPTASHHKARPNRRRKPPAQDWKAECTELLNELMSSADAEPFRQPVCLEQAPDYHLIVSHPMDLGTVHTRLSAGEYSSSEQLASDVRRVFANSRLYNTNKRSRIYSMTVRLSSLFESLWSRRPRYKRTQRSRRPAVKLSNGAAHSDSSDSEPLAATSRRVHANDGDSWDSDAPLTQHTKGKGVGKKSKTRHIAPAASTSTDIPPMVEEYLESSDELLNGLAATESEGSHGHISVVECTLEDSLPGTSGVRSRRRKRATSSEESEQSVRHRRKRQLRRPRERITDGSSSSTSRESSPLNGASVPRRYESDRSYHARDSSDDDAPLTAYRQRQTSGPTDRPRVSLRARHTPRRYNDSSEDDIAAISKRQSRARATAAQSHHQRVLHAHQSMVSSLNFDHTYSNGHAPPPSAPSRPHHSAVPEPREEEDRPVSISSRGRVRKLTVKARGLLRE